MTGLLVAHHGKTTKGSARAADDHLTGADPAEVAMAAKRQTRPTARIAADPEPR
jgi:hypothetical protein